MLEEHHSFELEEAIARVDDKKGLPLTETTRRDVLRTLNHVNLSGDLDLVEFLGRIWLVNEIGVDGLIYPSLVDKIRQHMCRNDGWDNDYLLERVGALDCSQSRFFRFLELVVDPLVRRDDHQQQLVERLNAVLDRDGYTLAPSDTISGYSVYRVATTDRGVSGAIKNLVLAADGPKPDIVLSDAINNDIVVLRNDEYCRVYERPIQAEGLLWRDLLAWWIAKTGEVDDTTAARSLYSRLLRSLAGVSEA